MSSPILLDCTLRDGGYPIQFQFTARDVRHICRGLERAGISHIEVGHGLGLGASGVQHGVAFERDDIYIQTAKSVVKKARIGAFFIPGIGVLDDIRRNLDAGLDFLRVGVNISEHEKAREFVDFAVNAGLDVHLNLMKSYALTEDAFSRIALSWCDSGLRSLYVVDSAGCMLPEEVSRYIATIRAQGLGAGFHGHNNLDLVNANNLSALDAGAEFVDATLRGMGRSAGNAQTEVMAYLLNRYCDCERYSLFELFETIEKFLAPIMLKPQGQSTLDVVTGVSRFHSGFLPKFKRVISEYDVELERLIMAVSAQNCIDPSDELIHAVAKDLVRTDG